MFSSTKRIIGPATLGLAALVLTFPCLTAKVRSFRSVRA